MKIKQVEELVGITRKNIRFYEEQGLLNVERAENGYREYHTADIARLQEIKLFRKMDISIEEMRALFEKRKSLQVCLEQHLGELERRREGLVKMQEMCQRLIAEHQSLDTLNAENCLEEIEQMEKEGARFMDIKKTDIRKKRRTGAIIGAVVMILLMGFTIGLMLWANTQDPIPTGLLIFLIAIPVVIIGGILAALAGRMKEIEGGEEDEASKYCIEYIPGVEFEALGIVKGTVVQTKNVGKDFMAGMKTLVGGEITGYTEMLNEARQIATKRMVDEAKEMNADAVIGVKYGSSQVMSGAAEVIAYGTAVKYK